MQYLISAFSDIMTDIESKLGWSARTLYIALFALALVALAAVIAAIVLGVKCRNRAKALAELYDEIDQLLGEEGHTAEREEAQANEELPDQDANAEREQPEEQPAEEQETSEETADEQAAEEPAPDPITADDELTMALEDMIEDIEKAEAEIEEAAQEEQSEAEQPAENPQEVPSPQVVEEEPEPEIIAEEPEEEPEITAEEYAPEVETEPETVAQQSEPEVETEPVSEEARPVEDHPEPVSEEPETYEPETIEENVPVEEIPVAEETPLEENAVTEQVSAQEPNTVTEEPPMQEAAAAVVVREERVVPAERRPAPERKRTVKKTDRLNVSFRGKVIQSPQEIQILCGEITDELTAYAGVEASENWRKICFYSGKKAVANLFYNSSVLTLTLAVDPGECAGLYGIIDATKIKRYAGTPTAIEIKSDRDKFTAIKAIARMMKNSGTVKRNVTRSRNYVTEYKTDEELVKLGLAR